MRRFGVAAGRVGSSAFRFGDGRSASWPSGSRLPLFGTHRFGDCPRRVGLRAHGFRFSACAASGLPSASWFFCLPFRRLPLGGLAFGFTASAFRHAPLRGLPSAGWFFRLPFRRLPLGGLAFGFTASAFRHAPIRGCPRRAGSSAFRFGDCPRRVGLRAHCFRFSARTDSGVPSAGWFFRWAGWPSGSLLPLFGTHRFGNCPRRVGLRVHRFCFSARIDPHRRTAEARTDGAHRHDTCFTSKHLSQHVNLPHRTP